MDRKPPVPKTQQAQREARLAEQLRANLAKRKAQSRSRRKQDEDITPAGEMTADDDA